MERVTLSPRTEMFSEKRDFLKGTVQNSQTEFPNGKYAFHLLVFYGSSRLTWIAFDRIFREKVVEMERPYPCGDFHLGFEASHLQQL